MRRRAKPPKAKVKAKRPAARRFPKNLEARVRDLETRLTESAGSGWPAPSTSGWEGSGATSGR